MEDKEQSRRWMLTINNPEETDEEFEKYIKELEHFKYAIFQREKGEKEETIHFQLFITFSIGKRFGTIKGYFPRAHIEKAQGTNVQCRDYCSKTETRVSGPYEIGQFSEERARNDIKTFYELIDAGVSDIELRNLYPSLFLREMNKINKLRQLEKSTLYSKQDRDIEVIYVYGPSGSGKTTYVRDLIRNENYFSVDTFDNSAFTGYISEDILFIDEFKGSGQFTLQFMNRLLDSPPLKLRGLNSLVSACFTKVYILSNFHYKDLYKLEQEENKGQYEGFVRRLNKIINVEPFGKLFVERETVFEDIPINEQKLYGKKKRVQKVIEYSKNGTSRIVFDINNPVKVEMLPLLDPNLDLPF